jgi:hypothetical protein
MSAKGYSVFLSLAGAAAALSCWVLGDKADEPVSAVAKSQRIAIASRKPAPAVLPPAPGFRGPNRSEARRPSPVEPRQKAPSNVVPSTAELTARAARVEQEANHDLRRLVNLLDLSEEQQDQVFQTLARYSPSWSPEMAVLPADGVGPAASGKKSLSAPPGFYTAPEIKAPADPKAPETADGTAAAVESDPMMDEIMALLSPEQQDTLIQEELDRAAWWAEILDQIATPDDIPALDAVAPPPAAMPPPAAGDTTAYEGSGILE